MKSFQDRIKLTSSQRVEVERYLGVSGVFNELIILKLVRKLKELENKLKEKKNEKSKNPSV